MQQSQATVRMIKYRFVECVSMLVMGLGWSYVVTAFAGAAQDRSLALDNLPATSAPCLI